jgi:hypothetical protein
MLFDPRVIFILIWLIECLGQVLFGGIYGNFEADTWLVVAITISSFLVGAQLVHVKLNSKSMMGLKNQTWMLQKLNAEVSEKFIYVVMFVFTLAVLLALYKMLKITGITDGVARPIECLKLQIVADSLAARDLAPIVKIFVMGVAISIFFLSAMTTKSKMVLFILLLSGLLFSVAATGRLLLLLLFLAISYLLYSKKMWGYKEILLSMIVFIVLFSLMAVVLNKKPKFDALGACEPLITKSSPSTSVVPNATVPKVGLPVTEEFTRSDQLKWNVQVYLLGGLAAFNHYVKTGEPHINGGAMLPNAIRNALNRVGANLPMRPALNPAVIMPLKSNVFTAIYPIYHDLDKLGVAIWFLFLGAAHQLLFKLSQSTQMPIFRYFYAISLYPLVMIIFEEAYISSPGFWAMFIITPVLLQALNAYFQNNKLNMLGRV